MILLLLLAAAGPNLVVSAASAGPVTAQTNFDKAAVAKLFPRLRVRETTDTVADEEWATLSVFRGKEELMQISPCNAGPVSSICIIYIRSRSARTADGARIGDSYKKLAKKVTDCGAGFEKDNGKVLCKSAKAANVMLVFSKSPVKFEGEMPPESELLGYKLEELRWLPPREH
jgi:Protein of unknown function (DUF1131)